MASRVYGYYLPPTLNRVGDSRQRPGNTSAQGDPTGLAGSDTTPTGLSSVAEQARTQRISIHAILDDFGNTMNALGADEPVREEVAAYLKTVQLQAAKDSPSVPFIRQTLKTAADSLDGYISVTLGQPSRVVRDWVEALLLQPIEYRQSAVATKADTKPEASPPAAASALGASTLSGVRVTASAPSAARPILSATNRPRALNESEKQAFRQAYDAGRELAAQGNTPSALAAFEQALTLAQEAGQTGLEGKTLFVMGKTAAASGDPSHQNAALAYYERAQQKFAESRQIEKQARALAAMGAIHDDRNELAQAASYYAGALAQSREVGNDKLTGRILNDAGMISLRQGRVVEAIAQFKASADTNSSPQGDPNLLPDIYNNLGEAWRLQNAPEQAAEAFRRSLKLSHEARDKDGFLDALTKLAALYEGIGQPEKALPYRQRLEKFQ